MSINTEYFADALLDSHHLDAFDRLGCFLATEYCFECIPHIVFSEPSYREENKGLFEIMVRGLVEKNDQEVILRTMRYGGDPDRFGFTLLHMVCLWGDPQILRAVLAILSQDDRAPKDARGRTPLHYCVLVKPVSRSMVRVLMGRLTVEQQKMKDASDYTARRLYQDVTPRNERRQNICDTLKPYNFAETI